MTKMSKEQEAKALEALVNLVRHQTKEVFFIPPAEFILRGQAVRKVGPTWHFDEMPYNTWRNYIVLSVDWVDLGYDDEEPVNPTNPGILTIAAMLRETTAVAQPHLNQEIFP